MLRGSFTHFRPLCQQSTLRSIRTPTPLLKRCINNSSKPDPDRGPRFRNFIALGIISYVILAQVVEAVNKENPRNKSMSESEYFKQQMKLKRRKAIFTQDEKSVWFLKSDDPEKLKSLKIDGFEILDPNVLLEKEKQDKDSLYYALLNDAEYKTLPTGLLVDLISKQLKASDSKKFIVINYPSDIKESVKFEEKVVTVKKLIHLKSSQDKGDDDDDVVKYYKTVNKVDEIKSDKDITKLLE
ncbi:unnamed protein product [Wickerhamomyces anomalus]